MAIDPNEGTRVWEYFVRLNNGVAQEITRVPMTFRTSTGERPTDEWLVTDGYIGYTDPGKPIYNPYREKVITHSLQSLPIVNNLITQTYEVATLVGEELDIATAKLRVAINTERERRISDGCTANIDGVGAIPIKGGSEDMRNMTNLGMIANLSIMAGSNTPIYFRDNNNAMHALTPTQMSQLWQKAIYYVSLVYQASWALKEISPLPTDYDLDSYWPDKVV